MIKPRGKNLYLYRRVPKRYQAVEDRQFVWISLHTDSPRIAEAKAEGTWAELIEAWEAKLHGDDADAEKRFEAAKELAAVRGYRYLPAAAVGKLPTEDLLRRVEAVPERRGKIDRREAAALLGGVVQPDITISKALDFYWSMTRDKTHGKSDDQLRRWRNPRIKAIANLISVIGDKALGQITGDDMLDFRTWWQDKIEAEDLTANSANKDLIHIGDILKTVSRMKRLGLVLPLSDLSFKQGEAGKRPPFSRQWISDKLLAPGALDGLNSEARAILLTMVNTGARPSEIAALTADQIKLGANVPHISINGVGRQLKTANARRCIPLLGASLEALRAFPEGFPRYWTSSATLSATINKYLRERGLMETPAHSLYGLRHSFEDRMLAAGIDERIRRDLLGHALGRERYGTGGSLEHVQELLQPVAL